jgi:O-antigen/teichoic acid export membrane protein
MLASLALTPTLLILVLRACAAGLQRWRLVAYEQALTAVLKLAGIAGLALVGDLTPLTAVIVLAVTPVLGGLAYLPLRRHSSAAAVFEHPPVATARVLSYGSRIWIGSLSGVLLARLDQAIMTPLSGTYQLGLYAVAVSVSDVALILNSAVRDVTFASDASTRDDERLVASARISGLMSLAIGLLLAACLPLGLPLLFGADFSPAVPAAFILLAAVVLVIPGSIAGAGLSARGRPGMRSLSLLVACVLNVGALFLLVPGLGAVGAALATLVGNIVASQLNIFCINRVSRIPLRDFYGFRRSDLAIISAKGRDAVSAIRDHRLQRFGAES